MLEALIDGERDPDLLADLARGPMRRKIPALREALVGHVNAHHAFLARVMLDRIDACTAQIAAVTGQIESELACHHNPAQRLEPVERLCHPGRVDTAGADHPRRNGVGHGPVPDHRAPGVLGGNVFG
jgi:hypothetical protein